jgi:hypothetical protein
MFEIYPRAVDCLGLTFAYKGDEIIWLWPWKRGDKPHLPWVSLSFTGNGDFGDARFPSLKAIDKAWHEYAEACRQMPAWLEEPFPRTDAERDDQQ